MVQDQKGTLEIWQREFRGLRMPYIFNLRTDPFEQATITSNTYWDWYIDHAWVMYPLSDVVGKFLANLSRSTRRGMKAGVVHDRRCAGIASACYPLDGHSGKARGVTLGGRSAKGARPLFNSLIKYECLGGLRCSDLRFICLLVAASVFGSPACQRC